MLLHVREHIGLKLENLKKRIIPASYVRKVFYFKNEFFLKKLSFVTRKMSVRHFLLLVITECYLKSDVA